MVEAMVKAAIIPTYKGLIFGLKVNKWSASRLASSFKRCVDIKRKYSDCDFLEL